jgi:predicted aminopeptidase
MLKNKRRKIAFVFLFGIFLFSIIYFQELRYGLGQLEGQIKILWNVVPVTTILADTSYADSTKNSLRWIQEIKQYAEDSLGIRATKNYTTFYDQKNKALLWNVTACQKYSLTPYQWSFPIVGTFSYKGFFEKEKANIELENLQKQGYDTDIYPVSGWSTLGFLQDPILSQWLKYSEGKLANLIIHELTHSTLYVKNNVSYNENLASFVGDLGAKKFLAQKYGQNSEQLCRYLEEQADAKVFRNYVLQAAKKLDSLYKSFPSNKTLASCETEKQVFIQDFVRNLQKQAFHNPKYYQYFEEELPNNTFFMGFIRYYEQQNAFEEEFATKFNSNFPQYMQYLKATYPHLL